MLSMADKLRKASTRHQINKLSDFSERHNLEIVQLSHPLNVCFLFQIVEVYLFMIKFYNVIYIIY